MRLDKFLADAGFGSRNDARKTIRKGNVKVNGEEVLDPAFPVDEERDAVAYCGRQIEFARNTYVVLNKPKGYLCATEDKSAPVVTELVGKLNRKGVFPVGRLDKDTTGVLLLTDDGALSHKLLAPKNHVDKKYHVTVDKPPADFDSVRGAFLRGIELDGKPTVPAILEKLDQTHYFVTLREGRFHQVKRMFAYFGSNVMELDRVSFASLSYEGLKPGEWRRLTEAEILELREK